MLKGGQKGGKERRINEEEREPGLGGAQIYCLAKKNRGEEKSRGEDEGETLKGGRRGQRSRRRRRGAG